MLGVILLMTKKQLELSVATRNKKYSSPTRSIGGEQSGADTGCSGTKIAQ